VRLDRRIDGIQVRLVDRSAGLVHPDPARHRQVTSAGRTDERRPFGLRELDHRPLVVASRGYLEKPLIGRALHHLYRWRNAGIALKHPADHIQAIEAYKEFGFDESQTLIWMKHDM
jgi:hypothetical protein